SCTPNCDGILRSSRCSVSVARRLRLLARIDNLFLGLDLIEASFVDDLQPIILNLTERLGAIINDVSFRLAQARRCGRIQRCCILLFLCRDCRRSLRLNKFATKLPIEGDCRLELNLELSNELPTRWIGFHPRNMFLGVSDERLYVGNRLLH